MELRDYIRVLIKSWWIIVPITLIALTGTLFFSYAETPIYEAVSTYVTRLDATLNTNDVVLFGLDVMGGRQNFFVTYCQVMTSQTVFQEALQLSNIDPLSLDPDLYTVTCNVLPDTNVLMLIVHGSSPAVVARLNEAVGMAGIREANGLYRTFQLQPLDPVRLAENPVSPNHPRNALLGAVLGLAIGVTAALLLEQWRAPRERLEQLSIRDAKFGVYNQRYFQRRFSEEINRSRARNRPLSVALLRLAPDEDFSLLPTSVQDVLLRAAAQRMEDGMRQGDIVAHMGRNTFAILLAETPGDEARAILAELHKNVRAHTFEADVYTANFSVNTGLVESSGGALGMQTMLEQAAEALRVAEQSGDNTIQLVRASPRPFVMGEQSNGNYRGAEAQAVSSLPFDNMELDSGIDDDLWKNVLQNFDLGEPPPQE